MLTRARPEVERALLDLTAGVPAGELDRIAATPAALRTDLQQRSAAGQE